MSYLGGATATTFDLSTYLASLDAEKLKTAEGRRELTRLDPLLWAIVYFRKSISHEGNITFADFHLDLARRARLWALPMGEPASTRDAYIAPRNYGKSTWLFKILPLWAGAHGHRKFLAAFTHNGRQAERWMGNLKRELDGNMLLRADFPELVTPAKRQETGKAFSDNQQTFVSASGFAVFASGIDSTSLGLNLDDARPDLILFDDVEPDASNYSMHEKEKRLHTIRSAVFPMEARAQVVFVGTVQMPGAIFHDFIEHNDTKPAQRGSEIRWVEENSIRVHHYEPLVQDKLTGERRSSWPQRWPTDYILSIEGSDDYALSWENRPKSMAGAYWKPDDFEYGSLPNGANVTVLSVDAAVTAGKKSDYTAFAVISFDADSRKWEVKDCYAKKLTPGEPIRLETSVILARFPEISAIVIETNNGGEWLFPAFEGFPGVDLWPVRRPSNQSKEMYDKYVLQKYQKRQVLHTERIPSLEQQMCAFPKGMHDDMVDAVVNGVRETERRYGYSLSTVSISSYI